ncbi:MAG: glycosyltransferase family 39 protein [Verrucomicrobiales bacterium]|nr:glycosyltransferase family 39 protein [Verrucomicrobiales bacterium]
MPAFLPSLHRRWRRFVNVRGPATAAVTVPLAVLLAGALAWLVATGGPWSASLRKSLATIEKLSDNKKIVAYMHLGISWGCVVMTILCSAALAGVRWWSRPTLPSRPEPDGPALTKGTRLVYLLCFLAAAGLGLYLRAPRLTHSFWNDEEMAFRKYVWGEYKPAADGSLKFERIPWRDALFDNLKSNNHLWSTLEARAGLALASQPEQNAPPGVPGFQERAARLFPFASSGLTILAVGWLGLLLGYPRSGVIAAFLLALSPWHMRYSVEIRGYSTMLLGVLLSLGCIIRALETGKWRWWIGFAAAQSLYLLNFAGAVFLATATNAAVAFALWTGRDKLANLLRLGVANIFSAAPLAVFLAPSILQIQAYVAGHSGEYPRLNAAWFQDLWAHLISGIPWTPHNTRGSAGICLEDLISENPLLEFIATKLLPALCIAGLGAMLWRNWRSRLVAVAILTGAAVASFQAMHTGVPFLGWYLLYLLPLFCLALAFIPAFAPAQLSWTPLVSLAAVFFLTAGPRQRMAGVPRQLIREVTQQARREATVPTGSNPAAITAVFGTSNRQVLSYDPRAIVLETVDDLHELVAHAGETKAPLTVYFCGLRRAKEEFPAILNELQNPSRWRYEPCRAGMEEMFSYHIYRWINPTP